ncbi:E3 ubiquitin-protein ligase pellino homolog 1-like [Styela clava]|uniref:E3 ubiquitin-protein ligase pellino homolog 1-like n=1 Tax=Styela clava TaxID=7725 RepID=UPI00193A93AA|nr:E3 ubiquitin-protein ligase pellino homolog 1-like [Styela clava]
MKDINIQMEETSMPMDVEHSSTFHHQKTQESCDTFFDSNGLPKDIKANDFSDMDFASTSKHEEIFKSASSTHKDDPIVYGELIVLGTNGCLPGGDRGRRKSSFTLQKRLKPNGVKPSNKQQVFEKPTHSDAFMSKEHHSVSYTLPRNVIVVTYESSSTTDMFQIGRSTEDPIDFVVMDILPGASIPSNQLKSHQPQQSTISRFSCRILCEREPPYTARIYAAGFDTSMNIILGEKAPKWKTDGLMDGLTTNGILLMKPKKSSMSRQSSEPAGWKEVSVGGRIYRLRETRSAQHPGLPITDEDNILEDGTLIDLCGATLLWRSASSMQRMPTPRHIDRLIEDINLERPQCPVGLTTLAFPRRSHANRPSEKQPWVYLACGHVHGRIDWGRRGEERMCPLCRTIGKYVPLWMGNEPAFYNDRGPPTHCLVPCGHVCSEVTAKFWALTPLPHGTQAFNAACPFCATQIEGDPGFVKLIWQPMLDG